MTASKQHPQRCETCVKYSVHTYSVHTKTRFCDGIVITGCGEDACVFEWVKTHGCASHCSASEPPEICCKCEDTPDVCGSDRIRCERAQAASEAREKVLDEANLVFIRVVDDIAENGDANWHKCDMLDKMQSVWCEVESLRQQEGKP